MPLQKISEITDIVERQKVLDHLGHPDPEDISPVKICYYGHSFVSHMVTYINTLPDYMQHFGIFPQQGSVVFEGKGGATVKRLREDENVRKILKMGPEIIVLEAGTNDLARADLSPKDVSDNMLELVRDMLDCHAREVVVDQVLLRGQEGMLRAVPEFEEKVHEYNRRIKDALQYQPRATFWHHRNLWNVDLEAHLEDGTHLNALGNKKLYRSVKGAMQSTMKKIRPAWATQPFDFY